MRVSNFLLWQIAYAEIWVTDTLWPDFRAPPPARGDPRLPEARAPLRRRSAPPARAITPATAARPKSAAVRDARPQRARPAAARPRHRLVPAAVWATHPVGVVVGARRSASTRGSPRLGSAGFPSGDRRRGDAGRLRRASGPACRSRWCWRRRCWSARLAAVGRGRARRRTPLRPPRSRCSRCCTSACRSALAAALHTRSRAAALLRAVPRPIVVSDSAQYYAGRALGPAAARAAHQPEEDGRGRDRRASSSAAAVTPLPGAPRLPDAPSWLLVLLGVLLAIVGHLGDLFESLLKRSAGVKDSLEPDSRPRRHPRSHRRAAVRGPGLLPVPALQRLSPAGIR